MSRNNLSGWMTEESCSYCHTTDSTDLFADPRVVKCETCGLFRFYPRISAEGVKIALSEGFKKTREVEFRPPNMKHQAITKMLKRQFPVFPADLRSLDVGCSIGGVVGCLDRLGFQASGLDPFSSAVEYGRRFGLDLHVGVFDEENITKKFNNESFSLISFMNSLYYFQNLQETLRLTRQLLRKDGYLLMQSFSLKSPYFWFNRKRMFSRLGYHTSFLPTFESLERILKKEGFIICDYHRPPFNWTGTLNLKIPDYISNSRLLSVGMRIANRVLSLPFQAVGRQDQILILAKLQ